MNEKRNKAYSGGESNGMMITAIIHDNNNNNNNNNNIYIYIYINNIIKLYILDIIMCMNNGIICGITFKLFNLI